MRRGFALLATAGLLSACSNANRATSARDDTRTATTAATSTTVPRCTVVSQLTLTRIDLQVGGQHRQALVHIPDHWNGNAAVPVVLSFHGLGGNPGPNDPRTVSSRSATRRTSSSRTRRPRARHLRSVRPGISPASVTSTT